MAFAGNNGAALMTRWIEEEFAYISLKRRYGVSNLEEERCLRRELQLPEFNGGTCEDWISKMEDIFHFFQLNEEARLKAAILSLDGDARRWVEEEQQWRRFYEWSELKLLLLLRFGGPPVFSLQGPKYQNTSLSHSFNESTKVMGQESVQLDNPHMVGPAETKVTDVSLSFDTGGESGEKSGNNVLGGFGGSVLLGSLGGQVDDPVNDLDIGGQNELLDPHLGQKVGMGSGSGGGPGNHASGGGKFVNGGPEVSRSGGGPDVTTGREEGGIKKVVDGGGHGAIVGGPAVFVDDNSNGGCGACEDDEYGGGGYVGCKGYVKRQVKDAGRGRLVKGGAEASGSGGGPGFAVGGDKIVKESDGGHGALAGGHGVIAGGCGGLEYLGKNSGDTCTSGGHDGGMAGGLFRGNLLERECGIWPNHPFVAVVRKQMQESASKGKLVKGLKNDIITQSGDKLSHVITEPEESNVDALKEVRPKYGLPYTKPTLPLPKVLKPLFLFISSLNIARPISQPSNSKPNSYPQFLKPNHPTQVQTKPTCLKLHFTPHSDPPSYSPKPNTSNNTPLPTPPLSKPTLLSFPPTSSSVLLPHLTKGPNPGHMNPNPSRVNQLESNPPFNLPPPYGPLSIHCQGRESSATFYPP